MPCLSGLTIVPFTFRGYGVLVNISRVWGPNVAIVLAFFTFWFRMQLSSTRSKMPARKERFSIRLSL